MALLTEQQLQNLRHYKYSGIDQSLVSKYLLQPYWCWLVELFPLWMAPNLITLLGFSCVVINVLLVLYYDPTLTGTCPSWVYYSCALGLWIYQSFDAIDGKQARRTGSSGPLGELFDHGCDALNTTLGVLIVTEAMQLGQSWWMALTLFTTLCNFYLSTWEEYHTGTLYLSYFSGPVEGVLIVITSLFATGYYGTEFWSMSYKQLMGLESLLPDSLLPDGQLNHATLVVSIILLCYNILSSLRNVVQKTPNGKLWSVLSTLLPFMLYTVTAYVWLRCSPFLLHSHMVPFCLYIGAVFGLIVGRIILAHVVHSPFPYMGRDFSPLLFFAVNAALPQFGLPPVMPFAYEATYLYMAMLVTGSMYVEFAYRVITELCAHLDIYCLSIKHKPVGEEKKKTAAATSAKGKKAQ